MRLSKPAAWFLFLLFIFVVTYVVVQREAVTDERVPRGGGSANSFTIRRGDCEKQGVECEEENGGTEDTDLENEDYIYTNSLLP